MAWPTIDDVLGCWPVDVEIDENLAAAIVEQAKQAKIRSRCNLTVFVRSRVPTSCGGERDLPGEKGWEETLYGRPPRGPFQYDTGGGWRNIRKTDTFS